MGNTASDVTNNVKAQADAGENEVYKLIDVKGGGELVKLVRNANTSRNFFGLNDEIKKRISKFILNDGEGEYFPIQTLVCKRAANKEKFKTQIVYNNDKINAKKLVCWTLDERGAVGETPLHLCLLNGTSLHLELARRLMVLYPKLIHDIYLSDEYYGEGMLHMAIVNEDPKMVKLLLANGADLHQRCSGKFFCPDDQKNHRQDVITQEHPILPLQTDYSSYSYFGEYPLSFAAVMNQMDCVRILLAKGADPNKQDSNGNTVMHMLVIHNQLPMFEYLLEHGADVNIKNNLNLTPLTLAAKLARKEFFSFIIEKIREMYWIYADVACAGYPLKNLDTISVNGFTNANSALYLIVNGVCYATYYKKLIDKTHVLKEFNNIFKDSKEHLDLLEGVVLQLLNEKWRKFIKIKFYIEFLLFFVYYILASTATIMKQSYYKYVVEETNCTEMFNNRTQLIETCQCIYLTPEDPQRYSRYVIEILVLLGALTYLILDAKELYIQKQKIYFKTLLDNPTKILFLFSCVTIVLIVPFRFACSHAAEDILVVLSVLFMSAYFLYFCRGIRRIGAFVLMIHKMIKGDLMRFFIIYAVFMMGFSQALFIIFEYGNYSHNATRFRTPIEAILNMYIMTLEEFYDIYLELDYVKHSFIGRVYHTLFLILVVIMLINLLIAMMANTYGQVNETKGEALRQWAKIALAIEQSVSIKKRLEYQKRYSHLMESNDRAFIVHWKQSDSERKELVSNRGLFRELMRNVE